MHNISAIRFASYLSPNMYPTYEYIAHYVGEKVGRLTTLTVGRSFEEFASGQVDVGFICGLPYVHLVDSLTCPVELLAAPVLQGERYQCKPIYFSDVIVRSDSPYTLFDDLQGCVWAYNQRTSHSGCNLVCYSLLERGKSPHYFGKTVETGSHRRSVQLVLEGQVDGTAVDSHMLDVFLSQHSDIATKLRIIDMLGPSSIPPVVVARRLDKELKCRMQEVLITMHLDPEAVRRLRQGLIERFVVVADDNYEDIRTMFARVQAVEFPFR
jgi:phosphonate transport system substrate-binding protein